MENNNRSGGMEGLAGFMRNEKLNKLGHIVKSSRKCNGITQQVLADYLGISRAMLFRYERGLVNIPILTAIKLASCLDFSLDRLKGNESPSDLQDFQKKMKIYILQDKIKEIEND